MEAPILKLRLVLDAGPDEEAFNVGGVVLATLNMENPDDVEGSGACVALSASHTTND